MPSSLDSTGKSIFKGGRGFGASAPLPAVFTPSGLSSRSQSGCGCSCGNLSSSSSSSMGASSCVLLFRGAGEKEKC